MKIGDVRSQCTVGTRLALKGYSATQIALRLGHKKPQSCTAYVDLARIAMQMRNPRFFRLMDNVGSVFTNPVVGRAGIEENLTPIISAEATTATEVALIGGGLCQNRMFAGDATTGEPWPCLSCPRFQLYEDAKLQSLWDILQERKTYMLHEDAAGTTASTLTSKHSLTATKPYSSAPTLHSCPLSTPASCFINSQATMK